jgi:hypothetical protein
MQGESDFVEPERVPGTARERFDGEGYAEGLGHARILDFDARTGEAEANHPAPDSEHSVSVSREVLNVVHMALRAISRASQTSSSI